MKQKTYVKVPPLKDTFSNKVKPMELTKEQEAIIAPFAQIQFEASAIDMLAGQYAMASMQQDKVKRKKCADLMLERARVLLENAEKLASVKSC